MSGDIRCRRIYDEASPGDGFRVLVDRLWPRGIKKADAALDLWAKDISPSQDLRIWFAHDLQKYAQFGELYSDELSVNPAAAEFAALCASKLEAENVTFLYAAKDTEMNNATVLRTWVMARIRYKSPGSAACARVDKI